MGFSFFAKNWTYLARPHLLYRAEKNLLTDPVCFNPLLPGNVEYVRQGDELLQNLILVHKPLAVHVYGESSSARFSIC